MHEAEVWCGDGRLATGRGAADQALVLYQSLCVISLEHLMSIIQGTYVSGI